MLDIFQFDFMIRAFIAGGVIAICAPFIGTFLVVRRYSLMADTLAHVALAGVAVGLLTKTQPIVTAIIAAVVAAIGIERLRSTKRIFGESVLALFLSGSLAIAAVLLSLAKGFNVNLFSFLFGSIATVTPTDLSIIVTLGIVVCVLILALYKELFFVSFDEELAKANGLRVRMLNMLLVILAAVTVALAMRIVGVLLIGALMVIPVITAMQVARSFLHTMVIAVMVSLVAVYSGLFFSYYLDLASGGTIVVVALLFFIISTVIQKRV
ncbi:MAG: metal ABC transporter permease [Candidatus Kerfeldbacteria bacterium]|nr:metal ABC transporter permease [Candidatus Kerfeldbacteria bacterium]